MPIELAKAIKSARLSRFYVASWCDIIGSLMPKKLGEITSYTFLPVHPLAAILDY